MHKLPRAARMVRDWAKEVGQDKVADLLNVSQSTVSRYASAQTVPEDYGTRALALKLRNIPLDAWKKLPAPSDAHGPSRPQGARSRRDRAGATAQAGDPNG